MARRDLPEINAGSMADIAFLLLIFFLVTTTMDVDTGIKRKLPPLPDEENPAPESQMVKKNMIVLQLATNKELILVETGAEEAGQGFAMPITELKDFIKSFVDNNGVNPNLSDSPDKAVISLKFSKKSAWDTFVKTNDAITQAYKELRDVEALRVFGKKYDELDKEKSKKIKEKYPLKLTETLKKS